MVEEVDTGSSPNSSVSIITLECYDSQTVFLMYSSFLFNTNTKTFGCCIVFIGSQVRIYKLHCCSKQSVNPVISVHISYPCV